MREDVSHRLSVRPSAPDTENFSKIEIERRAKWPQVKLKNVSMEKHHTAEHASPSRTVAFMICCPVPAASVRKTAGTNQNTSTQPATEH